MTPSDRAALREAASMATPGPWNVFDGDDLGFLEIAQRQEQGWQFGHVCTLDADDADGNEANARYIALAHPAAVLALLDECERMREALADILPIAEAAHDEQMAAAGHTGRPWPAEFVAARAALGDGA